MSRVSTQLKDLKVGDRIWTEVKVDRDDVADLNSQSNTAKAIKNGIPVKRICVVLVPGHTSVEVTYFATFNRSDTLPKRLSKDLWYPFKPATKEGKLDPLPGLHDKEDENKAQWVSLRTRHKVTKNPVDKMEPDVPVKSVNLIKEKMR
ncbi:hypothetical protein OG21DRAFT_371842 [Imleria badia]|nr:hypothetical protein OG21DRAFT_371842 [Imleria badia]